MTLDEKVGQLFEINGFGAGIRDKSPQMVKLNRQFYGVSNMAQLIRKFKPGGIIYFDWSNKLEDPRKVAALSNGIQRVARRQGAGVPMLISTDQEEGEVTRIGAPASVFPGNMALGATRGIGLTRRAARITGEELRAMGINVDNAPVVDTNLNPLNEADGIRSFGDRPSFVARYGVAAVRGYQTRASATGVAATAKHFPGLGDVAINPDDGAVSSPQTLAEVNKYNFPTLSAAIHAGVDQVMVTHILFPKITGSKFPSSLSLFWVDGELRGYLGYRGVIITDALDAAAVSSFPPAQVALRASGRGNDLLLEIAQPEELEGSDKPPANLLAARRAILAAVKRNPERMRELKASVVRILRLKWQLGLVADPLVEPGRVKQRGRHAGSPGRREGGGAALDHHAAQQRGPPAAGGEHRPEGPRHRVRGSDDGDARPSDRRPRPHPAGARHRLQPEPRTDRRSARRGARRANSSSSPPSTPGRRAPPRSNWSMTCSPPASRSSSPRSARRTTSPTCPPRRPSSPASTTSRPRWKRWWKRCSAKSNPRASCR